MKRLCIIGLVLFSCLLIGCTNKSKEYSCTPEGLEQKYGITLTEEEKVLSGIMYSMYDDIEPICNIAQDDAEYFLGVEGLKPEWLESYTIVDSLDTLDICIITRPKSGCEEKVVISYCDRLSEIREEYKGTEYEDITREEILEQVGSYYIFILGDKADDKLNQIKDSLYNNSK